MLEARVGGKTVRSWECLLASALIVGHQQWQWEQRHDLEYYVTSTATAERFYSTALMFLLPPPY